MEQGTTGKLRKAIALSGRNSFLSQARIASSTLTAILRVLDEKGLAGKPGTEIRAARPWDKARTTSQCKKWADVFAKLVAELGRHSETSLTISELYEDLGVPDRIRAIKTRPAVRVLSELNYAMPETLRYATVSQDEDVIRAYRSLVDRLVGTVWPRWKSKHIGTLEAGPLLSQLEKPINGNPPHLGVGFVKQVSREVGDIGFITIPGIRFYMSAVVVTRRRGEVPGDLLWDGLFDPGKGVRFHLLDGDCGQDYVYGQKRVEESLISTTVFKEIGSASLAILADLLDVTEQFPQDIVALVSDEGSCAEVREELTRRTAEYPDLRVLPEYEIGQFELASGFPAAFEISIAFRYDRRIARLLKDAVVSLFEHSYSDMADLYLAMAKAKNARGMHFDDEALRDPHYKHFLQKVDSTPNELCKEFHMPGCNSLFGHSAPIAQDLRELALGKKPEPYSIEARWTCINRHRASSSGPGA